MASDEESSKLVVPQFGSFKRKEAANSGSSHSGDSKRHKRSDDRHNSRRDDDHRSRHRSHGSSRHQSRRRSRDRNETLRENPKQPSKVKVDAPKNGDVSLFVVDIKGDPLIRRYGTIDKSKIPRYYRYGRGKVLGTEGRLFFQYEGTQEQFGLRMPGDGQPRLRDREGLRSRRSLAHPQPVQLRARRHDDEDEDEGFISMELSRKGKKDNADSSDDEQPTYRSIEGKAKATNTVEESDDDQSDTSLEVEDTELNNPLKWKTIQLRRQVKDHPEDVDSWLELVHHQDDLMREGREDGSFSEDEAHSYSEIKVSLLEKALENANDSMNKDRILVLLMREGPKIWTTKVAEKKWAELESNELSYELWKARLEFALTNITSFQYNSVKRMFVDRLQYTQQKSKTGDTKALEESIDIFLHATRFIQDCGYTELATAAWQGLFECTFCRPNSTDSRQTIPDSFGDFWESEVPRLGDANAKGWAYFVEHGESDEPPQTLQPVQSDATPSRDVYKAWGNAEYRASSRASVPARTMDDDTDDDPFRVVMYADIEQLLFMIPSALVLDLIPQLIDSFLLFSQLPPVFRSSAFIEEAYADATVLSTTFTTPTDRATTTEDRAEDLTRPPPWIDRADVHGVLSQSILFAGDSWFRTFIGLKQKGPAFYDWTMNIVDFLVHHTSIAQLGELYLGMKFTKYPSSTKKTARALLKRYPNDTKLYSAYALAEFASGNIEVAQNVLHSAIGSSAISSGRQGLILFLTSAWIDLELGNLDLGTQRLVSSANEALRSKESQAVSATHILKSKQAFNNHVGEALYEGDMKSAQTAAECFVLLQYLTVDGSNEPKSASQGNISASEGALDVILELYQHYGYQNTTSVEAILQSMGRLLYFHASKGPFRRTYLQEQITKYIHLAPRNTMLLALFEWADSGLRIIDDTRTLVKTTSLVPKYDCVSSRIFAIQHEISRGNIHTAKTSFEHAVRSDRCKTNWSLWVSYIEFCSSNRELRSKANEVFYRALRHCPWSKSTMLQAFGGGMIRSMKSDDLRSVYEMMSSKGLRVHVDMDEFVEKHRSEASSRSDRQR